MEEKWKKTQIRMKEEGGGDGEAQRIGREDGGRIENLRGRKRKREGGGGRRRKKNIREIQ